MTILHNPKLLSDLRDKYLFLDTNTFIAASKYKDYIGKLLLDLKNNGCTLITIPSVLFEFVRNTQSVADFNSNAKYLHSLATIYPIERHLDVDELRVFMIVQQRVNPKIKYTDFLLSACLYKFRYSGSCLMTEDKEDFSLDILDRKFIITFDTDKDIRNHSIYAFSQAKFNKAAERILKTS
jgi:hypothetical protein